MSRIEILEAPHWPVASFYAPMILFDHVVFVLAGTMVDAGAEFVGDGLGVAGMAVGGDLLRLDLGDRPGGVLFGVQHWLFRNLDDAGGQNGVGCAHNRNTPLIRLQACPNTFSR